MSRRKRIVFSLTYSLGLIVLPMEICARSQPAPPRAVTQYDELRESFARDTRNLKIAWADDDPRPERLRQDLLFEFVYQGYEGSVWVPQALFEAIRN